MIRVTPQPLGILSLPYTFYILYEIYLQRVGWLVTSRRLWERNSVPSLYIFDRELMKGSTLFHEILVVVSVANVSLMFSYVFVMFHNSIHVHFQ